MTPASDICDSVSMKRVPITPDIVKTLNALHKRSGLRAGTLLKYRNDVPKGLNAQIVKLWMNGNVETARQAHLDYVLEAWSASKGEITITPALRQKLNNELLRTKILLPNLSQLLSSQPYKKPSGLLIGRWQKGSVTTANRIIFDQMMEILTTLPDARVGKPKKRPLSPHSSSHPDRLPFLPKHKAAFRKELKRTRMSISGLFLQCGDKLPKGLTEGIMRGWLSGSVKTFNKQHFDKAMSAISNIPTRKHERSRLIESIPIAADRETITKAQLEALGMKAKALPMTRQKFSEIYADRLPDGFSYPMISSWLNQHTKTAKVGHVKQVIKAMESAIKAAHNK